MKVGIVSSDKWRVKDQNIRGKEKRLSIYVTKILTAKIEKRLYLAWFLSFEVISRMYSLAKDCQPIGGAGDTLAP